jgi:eukaryotic-like serine/threonine-protein kinase
MIGKDLGPYRVLERVGAGGMGEVYRARDAKLNRDVAIKILPDALAADPAALARFEREAQAVAALSHPNILAIHDFGREGDTAYAVMELLEGETLRARLAHGALPARKAAELAAQIAEGLAAAHEKGIVHRDLKPENVFVTHDGRAKVLDFGLAKRTDSASSPSASMQATGGHTSPGMVLGTAAYMSPEQVRGEAVDPRSDIFSFGAVLHEMLTGRPAFGRETATESMTAILKEDPAEIAVSGPGVPPGLQRIVQHCLEKRPGERFQSARDIAFALQALSGSAVASGPGVVVTRRSYRLWLVPLMLLTGLLAGWLIKAPGSPPLTIRRLTFGKGRLESARFLSGSRDVVYSARWQGQSPEVFILRPDSLSARPLGVPNASLLSVSRNEDLALQLDPRLWDGRPAGRLGQVATTEGGVRPLADQALEADWLPDGRRLAVLNTGSEARGRRLEFPLGTLAWETPYSIHSLRVSPRGDKVACFSEPSTIRGTGKIVVLDAMGRRTELADVVGFTGLAWGPDGQDIWYSLETGGSSRVFALSPSGKQRLLLHQAGRLRLLDAAPDGRILLSLDNDLKGVMGRSPAGGQERDLGWNEANMATQISADGKSVLLGRGDDWGTLLGSIFLRSTDGSPAVRVGEGERFALSPDGQEVLTWTSSSPSQLSLIPTGPGTPKTIPVGGSIFVSRLWFLRGRQGFLLWAIVPGRKVSLLVVGPEGGKAKPLLEGAAIWWGSEPVSPDGRYVAVIDYNQANVNTGGLKFVAVDGGPSVSVRGTREGDILSGWADAGGLLLFNRDGLPCRMVRLDLATGRRDLLHEIMPADPSGISGVQEIQMSADGRSYSYNYVRRLSDLYLVEGLK